MRYTTLAGVFVGLWLVGLSVVDAANTQYGPIKSGDSLWTIAKTLRPNASISVEKMAQLLFEHNPDAFIKNNKSQLKPGAMLYVPSSLVAKTKAPNSKESKESSKESAKALQQAQESIAQLQGENKQLKSRLDSLADAENKLQSLQRKISYQEDQLQALRKELKALSSQPVAESKPAMVAAAPEVGGKTTQAPAPSSPVSSSEPEANPPEVSALESSPDAMPVPVVAADTATASTQNTLILWLGAAGAGLIGMGLLGLLWRRRKSATEAEAEQGDMPDRQSDRLGDGPSVESLDQLLTQADIEFAKQNFKSSKTMLQRAKALDTADPEIRLRLLEVLHRLQEVAGFESEAKALHHLLQDETSPIWQQVVELGQDLNSKHPLFAQQAAVAISDIDESEAEATDPAIADFDREALDDEDLDHEMLPPSEISDLGLDDVGYLFQDRDFMADDGMDALAPEADVMGEGMAAPVDFDPLEAATDEVSTPKISALDDDTDEPAKMANQDLGFGPALDLANEMDDLTDPSLFAATEGSERGNLEYHDAMADEVGTKLELAQAFLDMGDSEQARNILQEVIQDGTVNQQQQANAMLAQL